MNDNITMLIVFIAGTLLLTIFAFFLIVYLITQKRKQNKFREEKEKLEQEILKTGLEVQEKAIDDMSRELHDNIGSRLNAMKRFLLALDMPGANEQQKKEIQQDCNELLNELIKDTRDLSHTLNSGFILSNGLVASVKKELEYVRKSTRLHCTVDVTGDYHSMEPGHELLLFRMIQEAIANVLKHAQASSLHIQMDYLPECFKVAIRDDGKGFEHAGQALKGIGLGNISNRVKMLKGVLDINSVPDKGTTITITIHHI